MSETERIALNPFYVLGLKPGCARAEVEREGAKLIGMLELKLSAAASYATPLGPRPRSVELVRQSMAELRDPDKRLGHELWARLPVRAIAASAPVAASDGERLRPYPQALVGLGWKAH